LAGPEQAVDPAKVFADGALADDGVIDRAAFGFGGDVVDEAVRAPVDADFPEALLDLRAIGVEHRAFNRRPDRPLRFRLLARHILVLAETLAPCNMQPRCAALYLIVVPPVARTLSSQKGGDA